MFPSSSLARLNFTLFSWHANLLFRLCPRTKSIKKHYSVMFFFQIWVGSSGTSQGKTKGKIYVVSTEKKSVEKELVGHADTVKALCSAEDRYVLSGAGKEEGKIAIWKVE